MALKRSQRVGIWIIAIVMCVGMLGSFLVMALSVKNSETDQQATYAEYAKMFNEMYSPLDGYSTDVFDASQVTELKVELLTHGAGDEIKSSDTLHVSYFGWTPDGLVFESTKQTDKEDSPKDIDLSKSIEGWSEALTGLNVGDIVRLTVPSDKAYGTTGGGIIQANTPLKFIIEIHGIVN